MSFKTARWAAAGLLLLTGAGFGAAAYAGPGGPRTALLAAGTIGLLSWLLVSVLWCRCPHCGRRMIRGVLLAGVCPGCGKDLLTGEPVRLKFK